MMFSALNADFSSVAQVVVWCFLPLYGAFLGLTAPLLSKASALTAPKPTGGKSPAGLYHTQILFFMGSLVAISCYRGHAGPFCQGQLSLTQFGAKFSLLILYILGAALATSTAMGAATSGASSLGFSVWYLGPTLAVLWSFVPLADQLTTTLLLLELIGVGLVWGLSSSASNPSLAVQRASTSAPGLVYALVIFVWASGLSALGLLAGLGLTTLEGGALNFAGCRGLANPDRAFIGLSEAALTLVLVLKFLMGGGQFLLLAWYKYLPPSGLVFYLFFYYPAHLLVGTTFFLGFFLGPLAVALAITTTALIAAAFALLPHLGAQTSPSLTLGGSSFVGLSFLALALFNLAS